MVATLEPPFHCLSTDNFVSRGCAGQVFAVSPNLVFKCPTFFLNPAPEQLLESEESFQKIEREKAIYEVLMCSYHPNIVRGVLCAPEGIFMERLECTLQFRLESREVTITSEQEVRWIRQLMSAVEWLASLGYAHGDLRPANILLDRQETLKVGDFDSTVRYGQQLLVATAPFCKLQDDHEPPIASSISEQYSVGSCIYNIRYRVEPFHQLLGPAMARKLIDEEFPDTSDDAEWGSIILSCWRGSYSSISQLKRTIFERSHGWRESLQDTTVIDYTSNFSGYRTLPSLVAESEEFLRRNRPRLLHGSPE